MHVDVVVHESCDEEIAVVVAILRGDGQERPTREMRGSREEVISLPTTAPRMPPVTAQAGQSRSSAQKHDGAHGLVFKHWQLALFLPLLEHCSVVHRTSTVRPRGGCKSASRYP